MLVPPSCSGLQSSSARLANKGLCRPALCANTPTGGPARRANGPARMGKRLANMSMGQDAVRMAHGPSQQHVERQSLYHSHRQRSIGKIKPLFTAHLPAPPSSSPAPTPRHRELPQPRQPCAASAGRQTAAAGPAGWCWVTGSRRSWGCCWGCSGRTAAGLGHFPLCPHCPIPEVSRGHSLEP
jgi:hypothetical protein